MAGHSFAVFGYMPILYYIRAVFSTVFLYRVDGEGQKNQPHGPRGHGGEGEGFVKIQLGDGLGLLRQVDGSRAAERKQAEKQVGQEGGNPAVEQLSGHICLDGQAAVPQEGQYLAVDRHPGPA